MPIEVKKNIPMPEFIKRKERQTQYPWKEMEQGDCFDMPEGTARKTAYSALVQANKRLSPKSFRIQRMDDGSLRVWRVE